MKLSDHEKQFLVACLKGSFTIEEANQNDDEDFSLANTYYSLKRKGLVGGWQFEEHRYMMEGHDRDNDIPVIKPQIIKVNRIVLKDVGEAIARVHAANNFRIKELKKELKQLAGIDVDELIKSNKFLSKPIPMEDEPEWLQRAPPENETNW